MNEDTIKKIDELLNNLKINDLSGYIKTTLQENKNSYKEILDYCNDCMMKDIEKLFLKYYASFDFKGSEKPGISRSFYESNDGKCAPVMGVIFGIIGFCCFIFFAIPAYGLGYMLGHLMDLPSLKKENNNKIYKYVEENKKIILEFYKKILEEEKSKIKEDIIKATTHVIVPKELDILPKYYFYKYPNCSCITLPNTIKIIEKDAFHFGKFLSKYTKIIFKGTADEWCSIIFHCIPSEYTEKIFFIDNSNLECEVVDVNLTNKNSKINDYSFARMANLQKVTIQEGINTIGKSAFANCENLREIYLPLSITLIEENAFYGCNNIKAIYYNGNYADWKKIKFSNSYSNPTFRFTDILYFKHENGDYLLPKIITVPINYKEISVNLFSDFKNIESIILQDGVELINTTFTLQSNLKKIEFPKTLKKVISDSFRYNNELEEVYFNGQEEDWINIIFENSNSNPMNNANKLYFKSESGEWFEPNSFDLASYSTGKNIFCGFKKIENLYLPKLNNIAISDLLEEIGFFKIEEIVNIYCPHNLTDLLSFIDENSFKKIKYITKNFYILDENGNYYNAINKIYLTIIDASNYKNYLSEHSKKIYDYNLRKSCTSYSLLMHKDEEIVGIKEVPSDNHILYVYCGSSLEWIGIEAFKNHSNLKKISLYPSLKSIGSSAFLGCNAIVEVIFNGSFEEWTNIIFEDEYSNPMYIGNNVNFNIKNTEELPIIGRNTTYINNYQFFGINTLINLKIHDNVIKLGSSVFEKCVNFKKIYISKTLTYIGKDAFKECSNLKDVYYNGTLLEWRKIKFENDFSDPTIYAENIYFYDEISNKYYKVEEFKFDNNLMNLTKEHTIGLTNIKKINIHKNILSINSDVFKKCKYLERVYYEGTINEWNKIKFENEFSNPLYYAKEIFFYEEDTKQYSTVKEFCIDGEIIIDHKVTKCLRNIENLKITSPTVQIKDNPFVYCHEIKCLELPCSIDINNLGLEEDTLKEINFNGGSKIEYILPGFSNLSKITLPNTLRFITENAFEECHNLKEVYFKGTLNDWCMIDFENRKSNPMYFAEKFYLLNEQNEWYLLTNLVVPNEITKIAKYQFYGFKQLISLNIDNHVDFIGTEAFKSCSNIKSLTISYIKNICKKPDKEKYNNLWFGKLAYNNIFDNCSVDVIYFKGSIREFFLMKHSKNMQSIFNSCKEINLIDAKEKIISVNNIINNEISNYCQKVFNVDGAVYFKCLDIGIENCYVTILKDQFSKDKKQKNKGLWKLFISYIPMENEKSLDLANEIIQKIKEKYAFLLIRSDIYIAISPLLFENSSQETLIYNYSDNYELIEFNYTNLKNKLSVFSVENIDEEFVIIENKNTDAIDCVKAYNNSLDIYDLTQEKLDSIYEHIEISRANNSKDRILIEGPARSGKTIIAFQLLHKYTDAKFLLMNYYFYRAIKDAFNAYNVAFPSDRIFHHDLSTGREMGCAARKGNKYNGWQSTFSINLDFIIVDEAQRLSNLPGRQGDYRWLPGFDQLDIVLEQPQTTILLGDDLQRLNHKKENGGFKEIKRKLSNLNLNYYNYHFSEAIGIPTYLVNSIKYMLYNDENYKDTLGDFNMLLTNDLSNFVSDFKNEPTNKKHYAFIPGVNSNSDSNELYRYGLNFYPYDRSDDYFLNSSYQSSYLFSTYEMISRELEVLYLYIPEAISYSKSNGIFDSSREVPQEFLLNHLYVNMTRATQKLVIYTKNKDLFEYLSNQISILNGTEVSKWKDLVIENQKINYVLSYSDKKKLEDLHKKLLMYDFEGFIHCATIDNVRKILSTNKLKSRSDSDGIFNDIADQGVISITSEFVKNHVRFYLKPNTPTLYRFAERESNLVILSFDYSITKDYEIYFSDGNAGSKHSKISGCIDNVLTYDWFTIFSRGPILETNKEEIIRKRNAELLVKGPVNVSKYLNTIYVKNNQIASKLKEEFPQYNEKIVVKREFF